MINLHEVGKIKTWIYALSSFQKARKQLQ